MSTLVSLWELSLLLSAVALLAVAALLLARAIGNGSTHRRAQIRKALLPAMLGGEGIETDGSRLSRKVAAQLTLELAELVRGNEREQLVASAGAAGATYELARRLRARAAQDRLVAAEALAMFPEFTTEVTEVALGDRNPDVRLGAALALAQEGRAPPACELVRELGIGTSENSLLVVSLMRDLVKADAAGVLALLGDPEVPDVAKLAATEALAESGAVGLSPLVEWMAKAAGSAGELQPRIYRALGKLGHPGGHAAIGAGLENEDWRVRAAAAEAAGRSGLASAVPRLTAMLDDEQWWVRFRAGEALARLGKDGRLALHRAAFDPAPAARAAAQATLAERSLA